MAQDSAGLHEAPETLNPETIDCHRAIVSLMEELEAVDWYDQRVEAAGDAELRAILAHNRDEEKEHAAMVLEWLRRRDTHFEKQLRKFLFSEGSIEERAEQPDQKATHLNAADGSLGIGDLREVAYE
ncbi:MAG: ferritin [Burkholderiales bacterium]|jgi:ferritin-like protein